MEDPKIEVLSEFQTSFFYISICTVKIFEIKCIYSSSLIAQKKECSTIGMNLSFIDLYDSKICTRNYKNKYI